MGRLESGRHSVRTGSRLSGDGDGYEGDKAGLGGVAVGLGWCAQQDVPSADTPGERTVARTVAPVPGPERLGHRPGTGPGCSHHRPLGRRLRRGRAPVFTRAGSAALIFEQTGGSPPRTWRDATGGVDGGSAGVARDVGHRNGQLELESGAAVCLEAFRHWPEPQRLPELSAPPKTSAAAYVKWRAGAEALNETRASPHQTCSKCCPMFSDVFHGAKDNGRGTLSASAIEERAGLPRIDYRWATCRYILENLKAQGVVVNEQSGPGPGAWRLAD